MFNVIRKCILKNNISVKNIKRYFEKHSDELSYMWRISNEDVVDIRHEAYDYINTYGTIYRLDGVYYNNQKMDSNIVNCLYVVVHDMTKGVLMMYPTASFNVLALESIDCITSNKNSIQLCLMDMIKDKLILVNINIIKTGTGEILAIKLE